MKHEPLLKYAPFSGTRLQPFEGTKRYLSTGDLQDESISFVNVTYQDRPSRADIAVEQGDVLFARMKGTKKVLEIDKALEDIVVSTGFAVLRPIKQCSATYLSIYLKSGDFERQKEKYCSGAIQPAITNAGIKNITIPFPPFDDQIRIAHLISKVEGLIAQRKKSLRLLDDLLKSTFFEMFGDPAFNPKNFTVMDLKQFYIDPKNGTKCGPFGSALKKEEYSSSGIPVWTMDNITTDGEFVEKGCLWINENKYKELEAYHSQNGDVIISRAGTVGKMCVVNSEYRRSIISTNLIRVRFGKDLLPEHFVSLMNYCKGRIGRLKTGADGTFTHMNTGILDGLRIPYPSLPLQNQFLQIIKKAEALKTHYRDSLKELENLYGSLSQRAFKGELDLSKVGIETRQAPPPPVEEEMTAQPYLLSPEAVQQLRAERKETRRTPFNLDYVKQAMAAQKLKGNLTYLDLKKALEQLSYDLKPQTKDIQQLILNLLESEPPFLKQVFDFSSPDSSEKQILFRLIDENKKS